MALTQKKYIGISAGDTFSCYEDLKKTIDQVQKKTDVLLYMRDSVTLKGAVKKRPRVASMANPDLLYHSIQYICVFGRRDTHRASSLKKILPHTLTSDGEKCKSEIKIGLTDDFQLLEVRKIIDVHNHEVTQQLYNLISEHRTSHCTPRYRNETDVLSSPKQSPKKRSKRSRRGVNYSEFSAVGSSKSPEDVKTKRHKPKAKHKKAKRKRNDCDFSVSRKKVKQDEYSRFSNSMIGLVKRDPMMMIESRFTKRLGFKNLVEELYQVNGAIVEVFENGLKPQAIYFQTLEMRNTFAAYPELIIIDSGIKIAQLGITLYVVLNADGNGQGVISCLWFVVNESIESFIYLMERFKTFNPDWGQIRMVMSDKELCHRNLMMSQIPDAFTFIPYFHAVKNFRRRIYSEEKYGFECEEDRNMCLGILKKMTLAKNQEIYAFYLERLKLYSPAAFFQYFLNNWHKVQDQWVDGVKNPFAYFVDQKNNGLDDINHIILSICDNFQAVASFFHDLMKSIGSLQLDRKQKALVVPVKGPVITSEFHIAEMQYRNLLTPYAFNFVKRQLHFSPKVRIQRSVSDEMSAIKSSKYGELVTSIISCPCVFSTVTSLPCSHIFAVRRDKGLPTYDVTLCKERWTLQYLRRTHDLPDDESGLVPDALFGYGGTPPSTPYTEDMDAGATPQTPSEADEAPFIPSCASSSVDAENITYDQNLEEELVNSFGNETAIFSSLDPVSNGLGLIRKSEKLNEDIVPNLDWIGLQETL